MIFPARPMTVPTLKMEKACDLLVSSMRNDEFIDLAKETMKNFHETDNLLQSILIIKQADDAVTKTEAKP